MVFSGLLPSTDRPSSSRAKASAESDLQPGFIYDEAQLPCIPPERPNLRDLNNSLVALAAVFPDIQIEVFRELLSNFDGESRLALVADALLKNRVTWVQGRWRTADQQGEAAGGVPRGDVFRSQEYIKAVRSLAWLEFKGLPRSTISAVLAESNHSYLDARRTLVTLSSKSWRFAISRLFLRRKAVATGEAEHHPLVIWRSTGQGSIIPTVRTTGNAELDRELYDTLIRPLKELDRAEREAKDRGLAVELNNEEAERAGATHECCCCFATSAFEEFTSCNRHGHMICFRCVQHSIKEALFGQGWLSSVNTDTGTLKCLAVEGDGCPGYIASDHIHRALMQEKSGADMLHRLYRRLAEHSLIASKLPLIHCPFCSYAEIDDIYTPSHETRPRIKANGIYNLILLIFCTAILILTLPIALVASLVCVLLSTNQTLWKYLATEWRKAMNRHCRRRRGLRFSCQNPMCARVSCLSCHKSWADIHVCNESSLLALRTQVEQAMSMAVKRVCPRCNTSFVKNAGCNKLTCPCGYKMCYVCRADLSDEGYRHFCDHFRPDGDPRPCRECDRCNLWESEDIEQVLTEAREEAERKWKEMEKRDLSGAEKAYLETGVATRKANVSVRRVFSGGNAPTFADLLDLVVELLFV
ncbi:E3 ubiquitin-protein ligase [Tolypocladium ophioglossoides CBS 100239]|uniref:E3 ubiquitin-protein ligase n=1 Tax=Tolypocladium ophioglossoides (strain CBS 100239) TaxID=1163406 RepID=A0A0L0N1J3_TOLOC|nr:E3 ubiquitin-protein ligase [Tolypocladium ophioglossoides CBS 100239]